ncbi:MAG: helix-hairpin-helix domain-containing protein [Candidatus Omnitrophota bacterium]
MFNLTGEEKKVILFLLFLAFCGLALSNLIKINNRIEKLIYPQVQLAKVDLNKVDLEQLTELKCISAKLASRIIEYRNSIQKFSNLEELMDVRGVGKKNFQKIKALFFIE